MSRKNRIDMDIHPVLFLILNFDVDGTIKKDSNKYNKSGGRPYYVGSTFWKENIQNLLNKYEKFLNIHVRLLTSRPKHSKELTDIANDLGLYSINSDGKKILNSNHYYTLYSGNNQAPKKELKVASTKRTMSKPKNIISSIHLSSNVAKAITMEMAIQEEMAQDNILASILIDDSKSVAASFNGSKPLLHFIDCPLKKFEDDSKEVKKQAELLFERIDNKIHNLLLVKCENYKLIHEVDSLISLLPEEKGSNSISDIKTIHLIKEMRDIRGIKEYDSSTFVELASLISTLNSQYSLEIELLKYRKDLVELMEQGNWRTLWGAMFTCRHRSTKLAFVDKFLTNGSNYKEDEFFSSKNGKLESIINKFRDKRKLPAEYQKAQLKF